MKQPFRVAFLGRPCPRTERLMAGLSPALQPRVYADWSRLDPAFAAELVAVLPGVAGHPAGPLAVPLVSLSPDEIGSAEQLEAQIWQARGEKAPKSRLLGPSAAMAKVRGNLALMAPTELPLLLTGESGTGKDVAALVAHELSPRSREAFVAVNCGAVPVALAETEFFGCVRGAFTGAENRTGFCQQALGGTLFLDEIGEMPAEIQAKMLRVLENNEIRRVGSGRVESADFRLICATNRDLAAEVRAGRFREDLYYRIHVLTARMPPLRERVEDIPVLVEHFLSLEGLALRGPVRVEPRGLAKLSAYDWPGNLRQLRNVILRAAVLSQGRDIGPSHLELD